jgi:FkbM family methyltransferase
MSPHALTRRLARYGLALCGYRIERIDRSRSIREHQEQLHELILDNQRRRAGSDFFFVQVGACDGVSFDSLYNFVMRRQLRGIVIEPLRDLYDELRANYSQCPSVIPLNVAIHRTAREIEMYRVSPAASGLPGWTKGIASLDPKYHKRSGIPSQYIITERVSCISWKELIEQNKVTHIDYLQIDTEGYDSEILEMLDFKKLRPAIIKFEHNVPYGVMSAEQLGLCISRLIEQKYHILTMPCDVIAHSQIDDVSQFPEDQAWRSRLIDL